MKRILGLFLLILGPAAEARADVESLAAALSKLPAAERRQRLIEGARKEGEVMFYSSSGQEEVDSLTALFAKTYPFVKILTVKKGGSQLFNLALMEYKGGQYLVDVYWAGTSTVGPLIREKGMIAKYLSPERRAIGEEFRDKEGLWTGTRSSIVIFAYHKNKLPSAKVPARYEDLLDPFWKDNLSVDSSPGRWTRVVVERLGWEKAEQFHRQLAEQNLKLHRGRTARLQLMLAGEFVGTPDINADNIVSMRKQGAPVEYAFLDPTILSLSAVVLAKNSPHPHAALLLYDLIIGEPGQNELAREDSAPVRDGIAVRDADLNRQYKKVLAERKFVVQSPANHEPELEEKYDQLYVRTLLRRAR